MTRIRRLSALAPLLLVAVLCSACPEGLTAPSNLPPDAKAAFQKTQVIHVLDLIRNVVRDGEATTPKVFSPRTALKVVTFHESALKIMDAASAGWQQAVKQGLDELIADKDVLPAEVATLRPYVSLLKATIGAL